MTETWRLRDPIHGLIVFRDHDETDRLAWQLIQTPEFQRLRRIRQLGVSEFVFPGATHTRFAHSIGVYHNARRLMEVIQREEGFKFDTDRARTALVAALLHDLGHGPFSHAFENAREAIAEAREVGPVEKHEKLTAKLILAESGGIRPVLEAVDGQLAEDVADLIRADDPTNIYHAVVSSSFDADRLDYLMRDRYMTGTEAGSIDYDWLIDNLTIDEIAVPQDSDEPERLPTFVFKLKGRQAAEDFLLARYRLYTQVYLHKTTRGFEQIVGAVFRCVGEGLSGRQDFGLGIDHPLVRFLKPDGDNIENYRDLDDAVVWGAIERMRSCGNAEIETLVGRLWNRQALRALDIFAEMGHDEEAQHNALRHLAAYAEGKIGKTIFRDDVTNYLYADYGGEAAKAHKVVRVRAGDGGLQEIHKFPDTVVNENLMKKTKLTRYYFLSDDERAKAEKVMKGR